MTTQLDNPYGEDDTPRLYDGYAKFCESKTATFLMKKVENAAKSMEGAVGTPLHPRLVVEHQLAQVQLDNAVLEEKLKALQQFTHDQNQQLQEARGRIEYLGDFLRELPQRVLILENSYASLHMATHKHHFVDSIVDAYKMGLNSKKAETTNQPEEKKDVKRD